MIDWVDIVLGGVGLSLLCVAWLAWQRLAGRIDPRMRGRKPAGRCCVPGELDTPDDAP